jgi:HEAT repeat protein
MPEDSWENFLPEIEELLKGPPSKLTSIAAEVVVNKNYAFTFKHARSSKHLPSFKWKHFKSRRDIVRNICLYVLENEKDWDMRRCAAFWLGEFGDSYAVLPLVRALDKGCRHELEQAILYALGRFCDSRAVPALVRRLKTGPYVAPISSAYPESPVREYDYWVISFTSIDVDMVSNIGICNQKIAADVLGRTRDERAAKALSEMLESDAPWNVRATSVRSLGYQKKAPLDALRRVLISKDYGLKVQAAISLGYLKDRKSLGVLSEILEKFTRSAKLCIAAAFALGEIGDPAAADVLARVLERHGKEDAISAYCAISLARLTDADVDEVLEKARDRGVQCAAMALAWRRGGDDIDYMNKLSLYWKNMIAAAEVRWGNAASMGMVMEQLENFEDYQIWALDEIFGMMPEGFPGFDYHAHKVWHREVLEIEEDRLFVYCGEADLYDIKRSLDLQFLRIREWYEKHKHRLKWNAKTRRYFLGD